MSDQPAPAALLDQLDRAARNLLDQISQESLGSTARESPTPCADWTVHELCRHLLGSVTQLTVAAEKGERPDEPTELNQPPWVAFPPAVDRLLAAWSKPEAWEGETPLGQSTVPATLAGSVAVMELTIHGWDLATAAGRPFTADEDIVATVTAFAHQIAQQLRPLGLFGPEQAAPEGADALTRLLAFTGRNVG